jgi:hypothetical protein
MPPPPDAPGERDPVAADLVVRVGSRAHMEFSALPNGGGVIRMGVRGGSLAIVLRDRDAIRRGLQAFGDLLSAVDSAQRRRGPLTAVPDSGSPDA